MLGGISLLRTVILTLSVLQSSCKKELYIGAFLSMTVEGSGWVAAGSLPGIQIAFEDINNCTEILKDYELKMVLKNTKCNRGYAFYQYVKLIQDSPQIIMILGGDCSVSTEPIADAAQHWNLVEVSYGAASSSLSDKGTFPFFVRTNQPENAGNPAKIRIMEMFRWSRVATIQGSELVFSSVVDHFHVLLSKENFTRLTTEALDKDPRSQLIKMKKKDAHIIYGVFYEDQARLVMCEAYKLGIYGPTYVWFLPGWYSDHWWEKVDSRVSCTPEQIKEAAGNYLSTTEGVVSNKWWTQKLPTGKTMSDVKDRYIKRANNQSFAFEMYYTMAYDTALAIALTLNKSIDILQAQGKSLDNFTYDDKETADLFKSILYNLSFEGISGLVRFNRHGDRIGLQYVLQFQDDKMVTLGYYDMLQKKIVIYDNASFYWPDGSPPKDRQVIVEELVAVNFGLFIFVLVLSCIGTIVAVIFVIFNVRYRNERFVKMSSPRLNVVILMGCCLVYLVTPLHGIDSTMLSMYSLDLVCQLEVWLVCIGFTMLYGALFARTWRVHVIFTLTTTERKAIKDRHLLGIVISLLVIDIIILSTWQVLDPLQAVSLYFAKVSDGVSYARPYVEVCSSNNINIWAGILIFYKGILLLFGAFLAWETRNVSYSELNDSRNIAISVYTILVSSMVGIPVLIFVKENRNFKFSVSSFFVFISTSVIIVLMFLPKVIAAMKVVAPTPDQPQGSAQFIFRSSQFLNPSNLLQTPYRSTTTNTKNSSGVPDLNHQQPACVH